MRRRRAGVTTTDLILIIALLAFAAAVAVSQVVRARVEAHEALAVENLRRIATACHYYQQKHQEYPESLAQLGSPSSNPPYLEERLTEQDQTKQGYHFVYDRLSPTEFRIHAIPVEPGRTGSRYFLGDQHGAIRAARRREATDGDDLVP